MRTLVIGGTRNLGPDLVAALLTRGDTVTVLNRGITPATLPAGIERLTADRSDPRSLQDAVGIRSFDLVVDTTLYTGHDAEVAVAQFADMVGRYVWWSTGQVYLVRAGLTAPFREADYDGPLVPPPPASDAYDHRNWAYGTDKRAAEDTLRTAFQDRQFPAVSLRMPMIHSIRDHYARVAGYVLRLLDGGPILVPAEGSGPIRHVFGPDVIAATVRAASAPDTPGRAFNIGGDDAVTLEEILARMGAVLGVEPSTRAVPRATLVGMGLLPGCSPFSDPWMSVLANDRSRAGLGARYTPLDTYLPELVEAARGHTAADVPGYARRSEELALSA